MKEDWESKYPFTDSHREIPVDDLGFDATINISEFMYYSTENVPFFSVEEDEIDPTTGDSLGTFLKPQPLDDTMFIALNTLACQVTNSALLDTRNDPGQQLYWLEQ